MKITLPTFRNYCFDQFYDSLPKYRPFLATGLRCCLVLLRMLPVTYFSRWRHESMRSFNKLSADTVLCARNKNTRFIRHVGSFVKMSFSAVELQLAPSSYKSKVWKDFGFKVFLRWPKSKTLLVIFLCYFLPFVNWPCSKRAGDWVRTYFFLVKISIELKMGHVIWKSIQKSVNLPNLMVIGLNTKAWYTVKIRELSMDWRTPVPPIHTKCTIPLGLNQ